MIFARASNAAAIIFVLTLTKMRGGRRSICDAHMHNHRDAMSRHLVIDGTIVVVAEAETTEGPFYEEESDYVSLWTDLTVAARAGSPGVTEDRASVLDGIPLALTFTLYDTSNSSGQETIQGAEVFLWHADAAGAYSAVESWMQPENTEGQMWLRGKLFTDVDGKVTFQTILPGWYQGRTVHYHFRIRLPGEENASSFAATSQLFVSDVDVASYGNTTPYSQNTQPRTSLAFDDIFNMLDQDVGEMLTLGLVGSATSGYEASINVGLAYDAESTIGSSGSSVNEDDTTASGSSVVVNEGEAQGEDATGGEKSDPVDAAGADVESTVTKGEGESSNSSADVSAGPKDAGKRYLRALFFLAGSSLLMSKSLL